MPSASLAPIAVFAYRRQDHLTRTLDALEACSGFGDSPVYIFSDGPRGVASDDDVAKVRAMLRARSRPNMILVEAPTNQGLASSIIGGVSRLCDEFGRVIVIEDDLVLNPTALLWFNDGLRRFEAAPEVFAISAYQFRIPEFKHRREGMFAPFASSWGWATWKRAWAQFDPSVQGWERLLQDEPFRRAYDLDDSFPMADHLLARLEGRHDSWASRWYWAMFAASAMTLFPPRSLVENIGFDETATHGGFRAIKRLIPQTRPYLWDSASPPVVPESVETRLADGRAFRGGLRRTGAMRNVKIKRLLKQIGLSLG